jgi:hypothetical protein
MLPAELERLLAEIDRFLARFYAESGTASALYSAADLLPSASFLVEPTEPLGRGGEVLVRQDGDECFLGLRFGTDLMSRFDSSCWTHHDLGVVAEEVSHLHALQLAAFHETTLSALDLEVLGEIDRFLVFLLGPGRAFFTGVPNSDQGCILDAVCELLFERRTFPTNPNLSQPAGNRSAQPATDLASYIKAEAIAFKHIRRAYAQDWTSHHQSDNSYPQARSYFCTVRSLVTGSGASTRLILEEPLHPHRGRWALEA